MKKRVLCTLLAVAMGSTLLTGCGAGTDEGETAAEETTPTEEADFEAEETDTDTAADEGEAAEEASSEEGRTFVVGFDAEYPPFGYMDDSGEYVGFDLDLAQKVCDNLGWTLEKKPINWDSKDMELNSGTIDCIWNGFTINGREDDYTWSDPYLDNEQVIVVAADSGIETLEDLAGRNVVVQTASAALDALNSDANAELTASFASLTENADYNTAFMNIDSGAADAVAVDIGVANYQLAQREEGKYVILDEPIQSEQYGIGFKKGNEELRDQVWAEVLKLYEDGTVTELAEQYGVDTSMICIGQ